MKLIKKRFNSFKWTKDETTKTKTWKKNYKEERKHANSWKETDFV